YLQGVSTTAAHLGCELVLFMLMLPCGCEDHHARLSGRLHILLALPQWSEFVLSKPAVLAAAPGSPSSADSTDPAVSRFLDAVWMERGLSSNTLAAYRADLTALSRWLAERGLPIMKTTRSDLQDFIAFRVHAGARPRSTARQLSSFRRFFR